MRCADCRHCTPKGDSPNVAWCGAYEVPVYTECEMTECTRMEPLTAAQMRARNDRKESQACQTCSTW